MGISYRIISVGDQIHVLQIDKFGLFDELPPNDHDNQNRDLQIEGEKVDNVEVWTEACPTLDQDQERIQSDSEDWTPWIGPILVR